MLICALRVSSPMPERFRAPRAGRKAALIAAQLELDDRDTGDARANQGHWDSALPASAGEPGADPRGIDTRPSVSPANTRAYCSSRAPR